MGEIIKFPKFPRHKVRRLPLPHIARAAWRIMSYLDPDDSVDDRVAALKEAIEFLEMENEA